VQAQLENQLAGCKCGAIRESDELAAARLEAAQARQAEAAARAEAESRARENAALERKVAQLREENARQARDRIALEAEVTERRMYAVQLAKEKAQIQLELATMRKEVERMGVEQEALDKWRSSFVLASLHGGEDGDSEATLSPTRTPTRSRSVPYSLPGESEDESQPSRPDIWVQVKTGKDEFDDTDEGVVLLAELRQQLALLDPETPPIKCSPIKELSPNPKCPNMRSCSRDLPETVTTAPGDRAGGAPRRLH
jgi:hypothetical protein